MDLADLHRDQCQTYIRFFQKKRLVQVGEVKELFREVKEGRLDAGNLLSPEEAETMLDGLEGAVTANFEEDLRRTVNMSVLAIQQLLTDADEQGLELQMDTSKIEDSHLIEEVDKLGKSNSNQNNGRRKGAGRLVSLRDEQQRIEQQNARLQKETLEQQRTIEELQEECDRAKQRESNLQYEIERLKSGTREQEQKSTDSDSKTLQAKLDKEMDAMVELRAELADAKDILMEKHGLDLDEIQKSMKTSKQFTQLKRLLVQKTDQLTDLRRRMLQYEPDEIEEVRHAKK